MFSNFDILITELRKSNFDFQPPKPQYNPLEEFVYRVREKENTHSRIITDILDPKGSHNQGSIFLESFLRAVLEQYSYDTISNVDFNYEEDFFIEREFCIKEYSSDRSDSGRIDIYIELKNAAGQYFGIIIENKINDATFQPNQLARYVDAIKNKFNRENKKDGKILTICIPRLCTTKIEERCVVILPDKLGDIFALASKHCNDKQVSNMMASYITCLRNINLINTSMNNSLKLFEFLKSNKSEVKLSDVKAIIDAYSQLPTLYLQSIDDAIKAHFSDNPDIKHTFDSTSKGYLDIWNDKIYYNKKTWQWLSITVDHDCIYFYLVSNEKNSESRDSKADLLDYGLGQTSGGVTWYKPINGSGEVDIDRFKISFKDELPDIESITERIIKILKDMESTFG